MPPVCCVCVPGCFSKDQVYLDGILRILRHRRNIDFKMLTSLGKVSFEDVERLRHLAVLNRTRIPHFMRDQERYLQHLDHIVAVNELDDSSLQELLPWSPCTTWSRRKNRRPLRTLVHRLYLVVPWISLKISVLSMLYLSDFFCKTWMITNKKGRTH